MRFQATFKTSDVRNNIVQRASQSPCTSLVHAGPLTRNPGCAVYSRQVNSLTPDVFAPRTFSPHVRMSLPIPGMSAQKIHFKIDLMWDVVQGRASYVLLVIKVCRADRLPCALYDRHR